MGRGFWLCERLKEQIVQKFQNNVSLKKVAENHWELFNFEILNLEINFGEIECQKVDVSAWAGNLPKALTHSSSLNKKYDKEGTQTVEPLKAFIRLSLNVLPLKIHKVEVSRFPVLWIVIWKKEEVMQHKDKSWTV